MTQPVVTLGETLALLTSEQPGPLRHARSLTVGIAGAESNLAIGVRRLGVAAAWLGRVGGDELGRMIHSSLAGQHVATTALVDPTAPTGLILKERRTSTRTRVRYYRAGSAGSQLCPADLDEATIAAARVLHITGITAALSDTARNALLAATELASVHRTAISLDLNYRRALWSPEQARAVLRELVSRADILFCTDDLVGAGDAFAAGYLAARCQHAEIHTRLATAATAGAYAVSASGDWEGAPFAEELAELDGAADAVTR